MQQFEEAGTEGGDEFMSFFGDFACVFMVLCHNYKRKKYVNENIANKKQQTMAQTPTTTTKLIEITS